MRVEEHELGGVRPRRRCVDRVAPEVPGEERVADRVPREDVAAATEDHRQGVADGLEELGEAGVDRLVGRLGGCGAPLAGAREAVQVLVLGVVEVQRAGQGVDHLGGRVEGLALLEPRVVGRADPGDHRQHLASHAGHPAPPAVDQWFATPEHIAREAERAVAAGHHRPLGDHPRHLRHGHQEPAGVPGLLLRLHPRGRRGREDHLSHTGLRR